MQASYTAAAIASTRIRQKLDNLRVEETKCHIYRVHDHLRNLNPSAYEPQILAIGPYHHGKDNTKLMEKHKLLYLKLLLQDQSIGPYVSAIEEIKQEALSRYADTMEDSILAEFTDIMLLDGCFIIELLRKDENRNLRQAGDPIFETKWMLGGMKRDLMLFENQIPFVVLCKLFNLVEGSDHRMLLPLILRFFGSINPGAGYRRPTYTGMANANDIKHLLHLIHVFWSPDSSDESPKNPVYSKSLRFVSAVTKLRDANVKFEKNDQWDSFFNITFENGTLKLSRLRITDRTEALFRNLIAYEQYFTESSQHNFVTDYVTFLDRIIDSPGDVEILCQHGILENWLGSDKVVSNIFNKLGDSVTICGSFRYARVCDYVNEHCQKRRNNWMATLRRNHLSSPWAILSLIAAVVLLLLTAVQTVCSVLQV